jgi:hypothetical protein
MRLAQGDVDTWQESYKEIFLASFSGEIEVQ